MKKILNPLVLAYQKMIAIALVKSTQKSGPRNALGGVALYVKKAEDPRGIHKNYLEGHYEYCGRKYPYRSVKRGGASVVPV